MSFFSMAAQPLTPSEWAMLTAQANLARVAYEPSGAADAASCFTDAGYGAPVVFTGGDAGEFQVYCGASPDGRRVAIAFRGTVPSLWGNVVTDLQAYDEPAKAVGQAGAKVHEGFQIAADALLPQVIAWLAGSSPDDLLITGHSLGGAIATYAGLILHEQHPALRVVTFASPRVGNAAFAAAFASRGIPHTRVVGDSDPVPTLPLEEMGYVHTGAALHLHDKPQRTWAAWFERLREKFDIIYDAETFHPLMKYLSRIGVELEAEAAHVAAAAASAAAAVLPAAVTGVNVEHSGPTVSDGAAATAGAVSSGAGAVPMAAALE